MRQTGPRTKTTLTKEQRAALENKPEAAKLNRSRSGRNRTFVDKPTTEKAPHGKDGKFKTKPQAAYEPSSSESESETEEIPVVRKKGRKVFDESESEPEVAPQRKKRTYQEST